MKKIIKTLLLVMVVVLALTVFVACEKENETPACAHQGGKATCTEAPVCELCGESYGEALGHKGGTSTCASLGICATCGEEYGELKAHTPEYFGEIEATCTEDGLSAGATCSVCGKILRNRFVIPAKGHVWANVPAKEATCEEAGYTACKICTVCEEVEGYEEIPATGHTMVEVEAKDPTCTEEGHTAYTVCDCGHTEGYEVLPAGHVVGEDGVCTGCGNVLVTTGDELIAALGAGKNALLMNDIVMDATLKCPYGNPVGVAQKGGVLDGNGHTLTVNGSGNYYAIITYGGTIKNLTINSGFRAIVLYTPTEDVIIDNVTIYGDDIVYGLNTAEYPTLEGIDIVVKNSTICGWVSFAGDYASVSFDNCDFIQGVAYDNAIGRLVRPYLSTTFTNCSFIKNAYLDLSALGAGETVTLVGCTVDGVDVTVDVFTTEEDSAEIPFTYEAPAGVELVLTTVEGGVSFHRHGYEATVTAPTCEAAGYTTYVCACGDTYTADEVAALGHNHSSVVTAPTCEAAGYTTYTCACGNTYTADETAPLGHSYAEGVCSTCGHSDPDYVAPTPAAGGSADLNTLGPVLSSGGDASYDKTFTTTNGWTTVNAAIQCGTTSSTASNPAFPVVGPDNSYKATCLNGKTSAPGKLVSPTLTGGIASLTLNYTKMFTDTKLSVTITITDLTTGAVYTQVVEREEEKNTKYVVWTYEWVLETPVEGDFTIEVVNNCPTGQDGNKDRITILSLEWTAPEKKAPALENAVLDCTTKDNRVSFSTEEQVWSQNGITLTLKRGEGSAYSDKAPIAFWAKGSLTLEGSGIKTIVIETGNTTYGTYVSNCFNGQPGVASVSAKSGVVTIVLSEEVDSFTIDNLAKQGQIKTITVNP